jgi:hypothetical protein
MPGPCTETMTQPTIRHLVSPQVDRSYHRILQSPVFAFDTVATEDSAAKSKHDNRGKPSKSKTRTKGSSSNSSKISNHRQHKANGVPVLGASLEESDNDEDRTNYLAPPASRTRARPASYYAPDAEASVLDQRRLRQYRFTPSNILYKTSASADDLHWEQPRQQQSNWQFNNNSQDQTTRNRKGGHAGVDSSSRWRSPSRHEETNERKTAEEQHEQKQRRNGNQSSQSKVVSRESLVTKLSEVTEHWSQTLDELGTAQKQLTFLSNRCHDQERQLEENQIRHLKMSETLQRERERVFEMEGVLLGLQRQVADLASERQTRLQDSHRRNITEEDADTAQKIEVLELRSVNQELKEKVVALMLDKAMLQQKQHQPLVSTSSSTTELENRSDGGGGGTTPPLPPPTATRDDFNSNALLVQRVADLERLNGVLRRSIKPQDSFARRASAGESLLRVTNMHDFDDNVIAEVARPSTAGL